MTNEQAIGILEKIFSDSTDTDYYTSNIFATAVVRGCEALEKQIPKKVEHYRTMAGNRAGICECGYSNSYDQN